MSRNANERYQDILESISRCETYRSHLSSSDPAVASMALDAVLRNLAVIGEAARALTPSEKAFSEDVPWAAISGLRNILVHEYFRIDTGLILDILDHELSALEAAIRGHLRA